jgi:hypothetical protein
MPADLGRVMPTVQPKQAQYGGAGQAIEIKPNDLLPSSIFVKSITENQPIR